jgi:carbonic anhydrase
MEKLQNLFSNNKKWVKSKTDKNVDFFNLMSEVHDPRYLWIGCSDSRVPVNEIVGLEPKEFFVHRNVANIFPHTDMNCLSVLEFAVNILKIQHVIVCGHYGCKGVKSAMENHQLGLVDNWLRNIRDVYAHFHVELEQITNEKDRYEHLVELNVMQQVLNVCHTTIVQNAWLKGQAVWVHGWVYDVATGLLKDLDCCISSIDQVEEIYRVKFEQHH